MSSSLAMANGLVMKPRAPASRQVRAASGVASALTTTTWVRGPPPACITRNCRSRSMPSSCGMCRSTRATSMPPPARASSAASPLSTATTRCPAFCRTPCSSRRLAAWSSATSTRIGRTRLRWRTKGSPKAMTFGACAAAVTGSVCTPSATGPGIGSSTGSGTGSNGSSTQKRLPTFSLLSNPMLPPMASASPLAMVVPKPVPWCLRAMLLSACSKASKIFARADAGMPIPVSATVKRSRTCLAPSPATPATVIRTSPEWVNLIALLSRFTNTWRKWPGSPRSRVGTPASTSTAYCRCLLRASGASIRLICSSSTCRSKLSWRSLSLPASIAEMSSTSSTSASNARVAACRVST